MGFFSKSFSGLSKFGQKLGKNAVKFGQKAIHTASAVGEGISKALPDVEKVAGTISKVAKAAAPYASMINPALGKGVQLVGQGADLVGQVSRRGQKADAGIRSGIEAAKGGNLNNAVQKIGGAATSFGKGLKNDAATGKGLLKAAGEIDRKQLMGGLRQGMLGR